MLELKLKKEGSLYAIRDTTKASDLTNLLEYLFFEYTRSDRAYIIENLKIIDEERDDEIILHGNGRSLCIDLENLDDIYICSFADYQKFEGRVPFVSREYSFVQELQQHYFKSFKIDRTSFLEVLNSWHTILDLRPHTLVLYQNKNNHVAFQSFESIEQAKKFISPSS